MTKDIRTQLNDYFAKINVEGITIIDWCSGRRKAENHINHKNCKIISVDRIPHRNPTIVADICKPITIGLADMAFLTEALEHCVDDNMALDNVYNNLKDGGVAIISVPEKCKRHGWDDVGDFRRYTREQIRTLLEKHNFKILEDYELRYDEADRLGYLLKVQK